MRAPKVLESGFGIPEVQGEVKMSAGGIPQELRAPKAGIAQEESDPVALGAVDSFKAFLTSRLDFKLPEDYKHSCPIFCSRGTAIQDNFKGEGWFVERLKQSDWISVRKRTFRVVV